MEPAYCALLFDTMGSPKYQPVMAFLDSLEEGGMLSDLYDYWPPPSDPEYPWTVADTSVFNMSIIFWALATQVTERVHRGVPVELVLDDLIDTTAVPPDPPPVTFEPRPLAVASNPALGKCELRFTLAVASKGSLEIYDAGGRRVRVVTSGVFARGENALTWDGSDENGRAAPGGVYFARLRAGSLADSRRFILAR